MKDFRLWLAALLFGAAFCFPAEALGAEPPEGQAAALLEQLQRVRPDPLHTYKVTDLRLQRDALRLHLEHGTLVFLEPVGGQVTGAVFEGAGEVLVLPPERGERQQLVKFTGSPILTDSFPRAYFRFSDETADELLAQIRAGAGQPDHQPELLARWEPLMDSLNRVHALRLLLDFLEPPLPYFYASIHGSRLGTFDVMVDDRRAEQVLAGRLVQLQGQRYYDIWCSFARRAGPAEPSPVRIPAYRIDATLTAEMELEAVAEVELELRRQARALLFELFRFLTVSEVTQVAPDGAERPLEFFQNTLLSAAEVGTRGSDVVLVVLPRAAPGEAPRRRTLRFRYRGRVVSDVGGGVLYVGARSLWYPNIDTGEPAHYRLRFRVPRSLELVATGNLQETRQEGDWKETLWVTDVPLPIAGFNLGDYDSREVQRGPVRVIAYANRQLEPSLERAARGESSPPLLPPLPPSWPERRTEALGREPAPPPAPPSEHLKKVANQVGDAVAVFAEMFAPFPYSSLKVSQIPGRFGQGYPGLLYLSTFSFLPEEDQVRMGLSQRSRELFSLLTPAHETAHQWWGNWVRFPGYRDQWLAEGLATYSAFLYLERQPGGAAVVRQWLQRFRADLQQEDSQGRTTDAIGALALGQRLDCSRSPDGFARLIYSKAPWVLHMLRQLFRDPESGSDEVFVGALGELARRGGTLTTAEFRQHLEAHLPPYADVEGSGRLDWFFEQWVYDTGIPRYRLEWELVGNQRAGWQVEGSIEQSDVSPLFTMPVPVYARTGSELRRLGTVVVTEEKVNFGFPVESAPDEIVLDPYRTVLFLPAE